jgi:hypothetical protein
LAKDASLEMLEGLSVNTQLAAALLGLSLARVKQLTDDGAFTKCAPGRWLLVKLIRDYVIVLRGERRSNPTKTTSEARVRDARAYEIEVRTAERLKRLVSIEEFDAAIDAVSGLFRAEMSGLPARVTRDLVLRRTIEREIHGSLERISKAADAAASRIEKGGEADEAVPDDDTRRMGGKQ